jgi:hypothetical protein
MRKKRKNYTAQEKVFILKRYLVDRVAVSDLCDEYNHKVEGEVRREFALRYNYLILKDPFFSLTGRL